MNATQIRPDRILAPQEVHDEIEKMVEAAYRRGWVDRRYFDSQPREVWDADHLDYLEREGLL